MTAVSDVHIFTSTLTHWQSTSGDVSPSYTRVMDYLISLVTMPVLAPASPCRRNYHGNVVRASHFVSVMGLSYPYISAKVSTTNAHKIEDLTKLTRITISHIMTIMASMMLTEVTK